MSETPTYILLQTYTPLGHQQAAREVELAVAAFKNALEPRLCVQVSYQGEGRAREALITAIDPASGRVGVTDYSGLERLIGSLLAMSIFYNATVCAPSELLAAT